MDTSKILQQCLHHHIHTSGSSYPSTGSMQFQDLSPDSIDRLVMMIFRS